MVYHEAAASDEAVPALVPAAFEQEILSLVIRIRQFQVCSAGVYRLQGHPPPGKLAAVAGAEDVEVQRAEIRRRHSVCGHASLVHESRAPQPAGNPAASFAVRVIEVGQPEIMAEFVAEGAYPRLSGVCSVVRAQFRAYGEGVDLYASYGKYAAVFPEGAVLGPDIFRSRSVRFARPGKQDEYVVDFRVSVVVVGGEVHGIPARCACLPDRFMQECVPAVAVVGSVVRHFLSERDYRGEIELEAVVSGRLVAEIPFRLRNLCGEHVRAAAEGNILELDRNHHHPEDGENKCERTNHTCTSLQDAI